MALAQFSRSRLRLAGAVLATLAAPMLALSVAAPSWSQASSKVIGIAAALVNDVRIKPAALTSFARAKLRQRIALADQLRTGADSRLQIALLDNTKISVGANAQLTIDKFVYDPNGGSVSLTAAKGALRFMSGPTKSTRTVRTPAATIGVRGTIFDAAVGELAVAIAQRERAIPPGTRHDPLTATLAVLRGPGPNRQGKASPGAIDVDAAGQSVALDQPLLAAYVPYAGARPIGPFTISLPGLNLLNDIILPPPPRREFVPASQGYPVPPDRHRDEPPWAVGGILPPPGATGPGPEPGFGAPGGIGPEFPGLGAFPPPRGRPDGNAQPPTRQPAGVAPQPAGQAVGTAPPADTAPPTNNTQPPPTAVQQQPAGAAPASTVNSNPIK